MVPLWWRGRAGIRIPGFISPAREFRSAWVSAWDFSADTAGDGITGGLTGAIVPSFLITTLTFPTAELLSIEVILGAVDVRVLAVLGVFAERHREDSLAHNMEQVRPTVSLDLIPAHSAVLTTAASQEGTPSAAGRASADFIVLADSMVAAAPMVGEVGGDSGQEEPTTTYYGEISNA